MIVRKNPSTNVCWDTNVSRHYGKQSPRLFNHSALNKSCPKCKELLSECRCPKDTAPQPGNFTAVMRMEKKGQAVRW